MRLELMVSQAVAWARVIERAVHDPGPWSFRTSSGTTPAHRIIDRERAEIVFTGVALPASDGAVELYAGGDFVTVMPMDFSQGNKVSWRMQLAAAIPS